MDPFIPLLLRLLVPLTLSLCLLSDLNDRNNQTWISLWTILGVIIARDLVYAFTLWNMVFYLSDFLLVLNYLLIGRSEHRLGVADIVLICFNVAAFSFLLLEPLHELIPEQGFYPSAILIVDSLFLYAGLSVSSRTADAGSRAVTDLRHLLFGLFAAVNLAAVFLGYERTQVQVLILPAAYIGHGVVLARYRAHISRQYRERIRVLSNEQRTILDFLVEIGTEITTNMDQARVFELIAATAVDATGADGGALYLVDEYEDILVPRAVKGIFPPLNPEERNFASASEMVDYLQNTPIKLGETVIGEVALSGEPLYLAHAPGDPRMSGNRARDILYIDSIMAVPLIVSNRVLGVLVLVKRIKNTPFSLREFEYLKVFASLTSVSIDNLFSYLELIEKSEVEREVEIASEIQRKLIPKKLPSVRRASLSAFSVPAKGVSGDYLDFIRLNRSKLGIVVSDVAGKGIPAAMVMIMIRSLFNLIASPDRTASAVLTLINRGIIGTIDIDHFATIGFLVYDQETREMVFSNAAHLPLQVYRCGSGQFLQVDTEGLPIGIDRKTVYTQKGMVLETGDIVLLFTDGITEAMNADGSLYGMERLRGVVEKHAHAQPEEIVRMVRSDMKKFAAGSEIRDDQSMVVMKIR
jgi:sigma-B regulation protein RsbU (phosphoserine phosphatase)